MPDVLETRLRSAAERAAFPPTPDLAAAVRPRLTQAPSRRRRLPARRPLVIALAALLLLPAGALAAIPSTRHAILDWLGLRHVKIERTTTQPVATTPSDPQLGDRVGLAAAKSRLDFAPLLPAALGEPSAVYVRDDPPGGRIVLVYGRIQVTELQGKGSQQFLQKMLGPDARVERLRVKGAGGVWITGAPHAVGYADRNGQFRDDRLQLAGDTLLWERDGLVLRIEGATSRAQALEVARSMS